MAKRRWERPVTEVQRFEPNEYVAACGDVNTVYKFVCDAGDSRKRYAVKDSSGNVAFISGRYMDGSYSYFHPCNITHESPANDTYLTGYHLDDVSTRGDENIQVVIWTENDTNVHCTLNLDMDTWEETKS